MATPGPSESTLERFWLPPPPSVAALPAIRSSLSTFPSPPLRVSRVGQLDAALLDHELEGILGGPVSKALAMINPGRRSWEPEMTALLRIAVLKMSLYDRGATYGSELQNLKYRNEWKHGDGLQSTAVDSSLQPVQKAAYMTLQVLPAYLHSRLRDRMLSSSWGDEPLPTSWFSLLDVRRAFKSRRRRTGEEEGQLGREWKRVVWELLSAGEKLGAVAGLVNFLVFLYDGRYRTLVDRILGMRLIYAQRSINRNVSFEFLNRQLVWEAFTEFLLFLMPLINLHRLRLRASRLLISTTSNSKILSTVLSALPAPLLKALRLPSRRPPPPPTSAPTDPKARPQGPLYFLPPNTCPICYTASAAPPTMPGEEDPSDPATTTAALAHLASAAAASGDTGVKVPYVTDCGWKCRYCYWCVVGKLVACEEEGEEAWSCLRCGEEVRAVEREVAEKLGEMEEKGGEEEEAEGVEGVEECSESGIVGEEESEVESVASEQERWRQ